LTLVTVKQSLVAKISVTTENFSADGGFVYAVCLLKAVYSTILSSLWSK